MTRTRPSPNSTACFSLNVSEIDPADSQCAATGLGAAVGGADGVAAGADPVDTGLDAEAVGDGAPLGAEEASGPAHPATRATAVMSAAILSIRTGLLLPGEDSGAARSVI
jgi:hypothetical protein